jgi:hypothetical protein
MAEKDRTDPIASQPLVEKSLASRPAVAVLIGFNVEEISGGRPVGCLQAGPQRANPIRWTRYTEETYAMWRTRQPDPRDREPRQSSCSISSRNRTSAWREPARCADRRRQIVHSARADHHRSNCAGPVSAGSPRRTLWEALRYAQIGGLSFATLVTLFTVPVIYSIVVLDLKVIKWREVKYGSNSAISCQF